MGRNFKGKATKTVQQKRRKKSGPSVGGTSPALSATSSSGSASTPGHRDCEQCGNSLLQERMAKAWPVSKKSVASTGCQVCEFVAYRRAQRPCAQCTRTGCDHFCEWCGQGFHGKCAELQHENVSHPNGFCCHKCEAEQSEEHADEMTRQGHQDTVGSRCGSCRLPFSMAGTDVDNVKMTMGFKVNQAVLVDNDEVLYNARITEVDSTNERIKIHFTRWSKSFDNWYAMDDEHINESLACDCCNQWFHIGCLPPIKSSGRWKDSTYVCPQCIDDARAFHHNSRSELKTNASFSISMSPAVVKAFTKGLERKLHEAKEETFEEVTMSHSLRKRNRNFMGALNCPIKTKEFANMTRAALASFDAKSEMESAVPSKTCSATLETTRKSRGITSTSPAAALNATNASEQMMEMVMHASPEHTVKVATEAHSSPSKAAAAKIGASNKCAVNAMKRDTDDRMATVKREPGIHQLSRNSSCNTVMSLLNSPLAQETPVQGLAPTMLLPVLTPADTLTSPAPSLGAPTNFQVYVKMEHQSVQSTLCSTPMLKLRSVQAVRKEVSLACTKPRGGQTTKQGPVDGTRCGGLSAFDILREVASQEIDDGGPPVQLKCEKRLFTRRVSAATSAHKRPRMEAFIDTSSTAASPSSVGVSCHSAAVASNQLRHTRERRHMHSYVDLHFGIRKEMYLRFCRLEEEGMLSRDSAHVLRSLIYPTSERFQDLKFVYLVNKDLSSIQLAKRLLEAVPYSSSVAKPIATVVAPGKSLADLPISMERVSTSLNCNASSAEASRVSLRRPSASGAALLRPDSLRPDESCAQPPQSSSCPGAVPITSTKRPEMLFVEQIAPTHHSVTRQPPPPQQQQLLNLR